MTHRTRIALAALVLFVVAAILGVCIHRDAGQERPAEIPPVLQHESGGLRFTYHVPTGMEGLFDLAADPRMLKNLGRERPADLQRLREELERKIGVKSLEELRGAHRDLIERLRALGYL